MSEVPPVLLRAYPPATSPSGPALHLPFRDGDLLVRETEKGKFSLLISEERPEDALYLGTLDGVPCLAYNAPETVLDAEIAYRAVNLRSLYGTVSDAEYLLAGYAGQLLHWQTISQFCGKCGNATGPVENAWAKKCLTCSYTFYPVVSPAVLMLVHDGGDRILLAHKPGWGTRYSILAGFVEPGESLEGCVARETLEEVGLPVTDIIYRGSQPWPFPHQLMIGFTAVCPTPDVPLQLDETELDKAEWFHRDALPDLPGKLSLSRQLIDAWLAERLATQA